MKITNYKIIEYSGHHLHVNSLLSLQQKKENIKCGKGKRKKKVSKNSYRERVEFQVKQQKGMNDLARSSVRTCSIKKCFVRGNVCGTK